ncbi:hypothetical protein FCV62_18975 [Vibrio kanaloae]|uniref:hypothetical protein n=1 Tax=Vibrio kanaloae TaxID=170673 RepID=UPI0010BF0C85|nr:hypothetical protein [Vibrio kanaloae]TKF76129.1 hypothetical protein FCV62_18975 [Vibrio kanaloae]
MNEKKAVRAINVAMKELNQYLTDLVHNISCYTSDEVARTAEISALHEVRIEYLEKLKLAVKGKVSKEAYMALRLTSLERGITEILYLDYIDFDEIDMTKEERKRYKEICDACDLINEAEYYL